MIHNMTKSPCLKEMARIANKKLFDNWRIHVEDISRIAEHGPKWDRLNINADDHKLVQGVFSFLKAEIKRTEK